MRPNHAQILQNAAMEVEYVDHYLSELCSVEDTGHLWRAWSGLLEHYVKAVSAMRRATDQGASKGWSDKLLSEQKSNEFLQYASQARHAASHVFEGKRAARHRSVLVGGVLGFSGDLNITLPSNSVIGPDGQVKRLPEGTLNTRDGKYHSGSIARSSVEEHDHHLILDTIVNRGVEWPLPNPKTVRSQQAQEIGKFVSIWLNTKLKEAKAL